MGRKPSFIPGTLEAIEQLKISNIKLIDEPTIKRGHNTMYKVQCLHCNKVYYKAIFTIGKSQCQCYKERVGAYNYKGDGSVCLVYYNRVKDRAVIRKIGFYISAMDMWNKFLEQNGKCALTGMDIVIQRNYRKKHLMNASLDRIDSKKPYTIDNIQWVHKDVNRMKNAYSEEYFIKMCKLIIKHNGRKRKNSTAD